MTSNTRFKFFPQLNALQDKRWVKSTSKFNLNLAEAYFNSDSLQDVFVKAIATDRILPCKEVIETFEFFQRVRKNSRADRVADLCCGHGLLGVLFAMFERDVNHVLLVDKEETDSRQKLINVAIEVAPWIQDKIETLNAKIDTQASWIEPNMSIVSAHACGVLSDLCIEVAIKSGGQLAILPCCYPQAKCKAPQALQNEFGLKAAFDIDRTYRLEAAGYLVRWAEIPREITPMNRVLCARKPARRLEDR
jgi:hypothetical protein